MDFFDIIKELWPQIVALFDKLYKMIKEKALEG